MIRSFADREAERIWRGERSRKLPPDVQGVARRKLRQLNRVSDPHQLAVLRGNPAGRVEG